MTKSYQKSSRSKFFYKQTTAQGWLLPFCHGIDTPFSEKVHSTAMVFNQSDLIFIQTTLIWCPKVTIQEILLFFFFFLPTKISYIKQKIYIFHIHHKAYFSDFYSQKQIVHVKTKNLHKFYFYLNSEIWCSKFLWWIIIQWR